MTDRRKTRALTVPDDARDLARARRLHRQCLFLARLRGGQALQRIRGGRYCVLGVQLGLEVLERDEEREERLDDARDVALHDAVPVLRERRARESAQHCGEKECDG